jgi:hypothetical protein
MKKLFVIFTAIKQKKNFIKELLNCKIIKKYFLGSENLLSFFYEQNFYRLTTF